VAGREMVKPGTTSMNQHAAASHEGLTVLPAWADRGQDHATT
jgi:hypothetical protein